MGLVVRAPVPARADWVLSRQFPRNMQEGNEHRRWPLLVVVLLSCGGCLKNRRFAEYTRHLYCLLQNAETCSHGYPQKMGSENSHATLTLKT